MKRASLLLALCLLPFIAGSVSAAGANGPAATDPIGKYIDGGPEDLTISLKILAMITILSVAPSILLLTTAFTRIVIVLGFVRRALSTQEVPPNQVIIGISLILTFMVMAPTWSRIHQNALVPFLDEEISDEEAFDIAVKEMRGFMVPQTDTRDLYLMVQIANKELLDPPADGGATGYQAFEDVYVDDIPTLTIMPAFLLSELKRAFEMGFLIYLPFLVIDLVVSSVLISMGMLVLPPVLISLPLKILVFVLADGWGLVVEQLALSFAT